MSASVSFKFRPGGEEAREEEKNVTHDSEHLTHRWRPLRDSPIGKRRRGAAIRRSAVRRYKQDENHRVRDRPARALPTK